MSQLSSTLHRVLELNECEKYERFGDGETVCMCTTCQDGLTEIFDAFLRVHDEHRQAASRSNIIKVHFPAVGAVKSVTKQLLTAFYQELRHMRVHPADFFTTITVFRMDTKAEIIAESAYICEKQKLFWATLISEVHAALDDVARNKPV